jgi:hypothetical protein
MTDVFECGDCPVCRGPVREYRGQLMWWVSCDSGSCPVSPSYSVMPGRYDGAVGE